MLQISQQNSQNFLNQPYMTNADRVDQILPFNMFYLIYGLLQISFSLLASKESN